MRFVNPSHLPPRAPPHGSPPPPIPPHPLRPLHRAGEPYQDFSVAGYDYEGEEYLNGKLVEKYFREFPEDPFFPALGYDLLFVDRGDGEGRPARPVLAQTVVQPLGITVFSVNTSYADWIAAPQPSSAFAVRALEECPMSKACDSGVADPLRTALRAATRAMRRAKAAAGA